MNYSYQGNLALLGNVKREQEILPERMEYLFRDIKTPAQAIVFAIHYAGRNQTVVGEELGLTRSHWSGIVNGNKNMSFKLKKQFMDLIGNDLLLQWEAWNRGYRLVKREPTEQDRVAEENERLKREIEQLKQQRG